MAQSFFHPPVENTHNKAALDVHHSHRSKMPLSASHRQDGFIGAIAFAVVDKIITDRFNDKTIAKTLLMELKQRFPDSVPKAAHTNAIDTLGLMTNKAAKASKTALNMTSVLRTLMVNLMCEAPLKYLSAFCQQGDIIKPSSLLQQGAEIDKVGLDALANLLDMTITLHTTEEDKPLPARVKYGHGSSEIHIDEHGGRFAPRVKKPEVFRPVSSMTPVKQADASDNFQDERVAHQAQSLSKQIDDSNQANIEWLYSMLEHEDNGLSIDDLLNFYIANSDKANRNQFVKPSNTLASALVHTIASMITSGAVSREDIFASNELQKTVSSPIMA